MTITKVQADGVTCGGRSIVEIIPGFPEWSFGVLMKARLKSPRHTYALQGKQEWSVMLSAYEDMGRV